MHSLEIKRWLAAGAVSLMALAAAPLQAGPVLDRIAKGGNLVIGHRDSSVPFSYLDGNGKPIGYAMDLCLSIAEAVRKKTGNKSMKVEMVPVTSANRIQMVADGKVDLECGSTTNNAERRTKVAFAMPHFITGARLMVRADSKIERLEDMEGKTLVSTKGSTPLKAVTLANNDRLLKIKIIEAPDHQKAVEMVESGAADAFAMDDVLLFGLRAARTKPEALKIVGKFMTTEALAIAIPKADPELKKLADDTLREMIYSKQMEAVYAKWFKGPIPPKNTALNLPESYLLKEYWQFPTDQVP
jgi:glutamate/aspartate transport system substrate-binding protein